MEYLAARANTVSINFRQVAGALNSQMACEENKIRERLEFVIQMARKPQPHH